MVDQMHLLPVHEEFTWEVTTAGKWLDQLDIAISSGEIYIEELDLLIGRYPNAGHEPQIEESAADLLLEQLLPDRHPEAVALLDALHKAYGQAAVDILLVALVLLCDKINDATGVKKSI
jgi:predicted nucleic acid-binding protein